MARFQSRSVQWRANLIKKLATDGSNLAGT